MGYRLTPFNPSTPYDNQVTTELSYANENFTILGQAFYNNDPSSQPVLRASYIGPTAPSNPAAGMTWLNTSSNPPVLKVYDGSAWQSNSDKVDGFDASQTPTANTIPVLDANGILNLPNTPAIITNTYTFRRVDLTNATSDYSLAVGEEAFYTMTSTNTQPLRIAVQTGAVYEIIFRDNTPPPSSATASALVLLPNNTNYSGQFNTTIIAYINGGSGVLVASTTSNSAFAFDQVGGGVARAIVDTNNYVLLSTNYGKFTNGTTAGQITYVATHWRTPTTWTSLGTLNTAHTVSSATVLVRRIA